MAQALVFDEEMHLEPIVVQVLRPGFVFATARLIKMMWLPGRKHSVESSSRDFQQLAPVP
jgi:hypothetical protein